MKYLLLGGSGFIGSNLAAALSNQHSVTIAGSQPSFKLKNAKYIQIDFTKCKDFTEYIKDVDVVVHLVSTIIPSDNLSNINQEIVDNVFPTTTLLQNAAELKKEVVFISSGGTIYGENDQPNLESDQTNPINNYGISKLIIEKYFNLFHHFYDLKYKIIRLSNPYSELIYHGKKQGIIPIVIDSIINNNVIDMWGEHQTRDYIHIDDAISGIISILNYTGNEHIFNIGSGTGTTVNEIIKIVENNLCKKAIIKNHPARKCDVQKNILDISKIKHETGWKPTISISEGINRIIAAKQGLNHEK